MAFEQNQGENSLPVRIRQGHKQECPACNYTGKSLIDHLQENHTDVCEKYERSSRGVWVLDESPGETSETRDLRSGKDREHKDTDEDSDELREKERRIAELEGRLEEMEERVEELIETRESLKEVAQEALSRLPATDADPERVTLHSGGRQESENGKTGVVTGEGSTEEDGNSVADPIDERHEKLVIQRKDGPLS